VVSHDVDEDDLLLLVYTYGFVGKKRQREALILGAHLDGIGLMEASDEPVYVFDVVRYVQ
jgi:hypothetical protein